MRLNFYTSVRSDTRLGSGPLLMGPHVAVALHLQREGAPRRPLRRSSKWTAKKERNRAIVCWI